jgi:hypothetical protein
VPRQNHLRLLQPKQNRHLIYYKVITEFFVQMNNYFESDFVLKVCSFKYHLLVLDDYKSPIMDHVGSTTP